MRKEAPAHKPQRGNVVREILPFVWFDIPTVNFERAIKFYAELLGGEVKIDSSAGGKLGFLPMQDDEGIGGTLVPPESGRKPCDGTRLYLGCEGKLDEIAARVVRAGGIILRSKFSIGKAGWLIMIKDSEGNILGLHSFK